MSARATSLHWDSISRMRLLDRTKEVFSFRGISSMSSSAGCLSAFLRQRSTASSISLSLNGFRITSTAPRRAAAKTWFNARRSGTSEHDDGKRWVGRMNIRKQAEGILVPFIVGNVAVHQKQIRLGRFSQAPAEFASLGIQAHTEAVRKNPVNIVQNRRIGVEDCDLGLAWARSLHRPHNLACSPFSHLHTR